MPCSKWLQQEIPEDPELLFQCFEDMAEGAESADLAALSKLSPKRELLKTVEGGVATLTPNKIKYKRAAICQSQGDLAAVPCQHCTEGKAPFQECIALDGYLGGMCGNCYLNYADLRNSIISCMTKGIIHSRTTISNYH